MVAYSDCVTVSENELRKTWVCDILKALSGHSIEEYWKILSVES
jgi:hypothetical protein